MAMNVILTVSTLADWKIDKDLPNASIIQKMFRISNLVTSGLRSFAYDWR